MVVVVSSAGIKGGQIQLLQSAAAEEHLTKGAGLGGIPLIQTVDLFQTVASFKELGELRHIGCVDVGHIYVNQIATVVEHTVQRNQAGGIPVVEINRFQAGAVGKRIAIAFSDVSFLSYHFSPSGVAYNHYICKPCLKCMISFKEKPQRYNGIRYHYLSLFPKSQIKFYCEPPQIFAPGFVHNVP